MGFRAPWYRTAPVRRLNDPSRRDYDTVYLYASDFSEGLVVLQRPGRYVLRESVVYNPKRMRQSLEEILELHAEVPHAGAPHILGDFAAVVMYGRNIELDLNGHVLMQSPLHHLQQRFFALVELGDWPFLPGQGPADFGRPVLKGCTNVKVHNGSMGLTAHYAIHGNNCTKVTIANLDMYNFEVAGISLNNAEQLLIEKVHVHHNLARLPVRAQFLHAVFLHKYLVQRRDHMPSQITVDGRAYTVEAVQVQLRKALVDAHVDLMAGAAVGTQNADAKAFLMEEMLRAGRACVRDCTEPPGAVGERLCPGTRCQ